ncbi:hypothetical protein DFH06DRAFT_1153112 [Mycena polygramma]|nr:hypothetical protein DFH06DRAFT_1153112 [Mycena polygramma]
MSPVVGNGVRHHRIVAPADGELAGTRCRIAPDSEFPTSFLVFLGLDSGSGFGARDKDKIVRPSDVRLVWLRAPESSRQGSPQWKEERSPLGPLLPYRRLGISHFRTAQEAGAPKAGDLMDGYKTQYSTSQQDEKIRIEARPNFQPLQIWMWAAVSDERLPTDLVSRDRSQIMMRSRRKERRGMHACDHVFYATSTVFSAADCRTWRRGKAPITGAYQESGAALCALFLRFYLVLAGSILRPTQSHGFSDHFLRPTLCQSSETPLVVAWAGRSSADGVCMSVHPVPSEAMLPAIHRPDVGSVEAAGHI